MTPPAPANPSPGPFILRIDAPDTPADREWLVGWACCLAQPMVDGQLLPDPWIWPTLGTTAAAWLVTGPGPERAKMTVRNTWLVNDHGADPLTVSFHPVESAYRCTLTLAGSLFAHSWAREELAIYIQLVRLVRPSYHIACEEREGFEPNPPTRSKELLAIARQGVYWRLCQFRIDLRNAPCSPPLARDKQWLDGTIHAMIDEELRRGLLHPNDVRSRLVTYLDVLHTPAGQLSVWERRLPHFA